MNIVNNYILNFSINILYNIFNKPIKNLIKLRNLLYSYWIKNEFYSCGKNFRIKPSCGIKGGKYIDIGDNFNALKNIRIECWDIYSNQKFSPIIKIGNNISMNNNIHIGCINKIIIGNNVLFASNIYISDHSHGYIDSRDIKIPPTKRNLFSKGAVIIHDNVWIGENVSILPNVEIGEGCIIGANAVVTKSFPSYSVIAGNPAKIIKLLNDCK